MSIAPQTIPYPGVETTTEQVSVPITLLQKMSEAAEAFEAFQNELEDYLLSQDADFLTRMRQARSHHLMRETRALDTLKQELCIE